MRKKYSQSECFSLSNGYHEGPVVDRLRRHVVMLFRVVCKRVPAMDRAFPVMNSDFPVMRSVRAVNIKGISTVRTAIPSIRTAIPTARMAAGASA